MLVFATGLLVVAVVAGVTGYCGPAWSQRLGNAATILSVAVMMLRAGAQEVHAPEATLFDWEKISAVLSIMGASWMLLGDIICRSATCKTTFKEELIREINR